jgi:hypothetical protein
MHRLSVRRPGALARDRVAKAKLKREEETIKNRVVAELAAANANKLTSPIGDITIGNPWKKTSWKEVAHAARPAVAALPQIERELLALRADVVDDGHRSALLLQRIDSLRAQLGSISPAFDELVAANTTLCDPTVNRPRAWTKDVGDDEEEH